MPSILFYKEINKVPLFSISEEICKEHKEYYKKLEEVQSSSLDITSWILWYIKCMNNAVLSSLSNLRILQVKLNFWNNIRSQNIVLNDRQKKILTLLLDNFKGKLTISKYAKICKCTNEEATEDINTLVTKGLLEESLDSSEKSSYTIVL